MSVIAIMGAGQGMGQAIGKLFGQHGHKVALLSRDPAKLEPIVAELAAAGIEAAAFRADVTNAASIKAGLASVKQRFGAIDVLEYSPSNPTLPQASASQITRDTLQAWFDFQVFGAIAAVAEVLPGMLERQCGTILVTTGASSVRPELGYAPFNAAGVAMGALRNWPSPSTPNLRPRACRSATLRSALSSARAPKRAPRPSRRSIGNCTPTVMRLSACSADSRQACDAFADQVRADTAEAGV